MWREAFRPSADEDIAFCRFAMVVGLFRQKMYGALHAKMSLARAQKLAGLPGLLKVENLESKGVKKDYLLRLLFFEGPRQNVWALATVFSQSTKPHSV